MERVELVNVVWMRPFEFAITECTYSKLGLFSFAYQPLGPREPLPAHGREDSGD